MNTRLHSPSASIRIQSSEWVCLRSVCCSVTAFASVYFWLTGLRAASMCICVCVCVSCHSTLLSRHAALLLPQYACSRIPAPLFIFSSPHHNLTLSLCLLVMDLLALLPPSLRWNTNPAEAEKGCAISWMSVVCVSVCKCVYGGGNTHTWPRLYSVSNTW